MGLESNEGSGTFVSIADGKIVQSFKENGEGRKVKVNKSGNTRYVVEYDAISGVPVGLKLKKSDNPSFSDQYILTLLDGDDRFLVTFYKSSRVSAAILKAIPNVDLSQSVRVFPWKMQDSKDKTKEIQGVTLYQKGKGYEKDKVPPAYTKEEPNGLPEMKKVKIKGKEQWDSSDMDEFLEEKALAHFAKNKPTAEFVGDGPKDDTETPF